MREHECEICALAVIIVHGVHGKIMQQVRVGRLIHQMDVQHLMEQKRFMYSIKMHYEMELYRQMIV